MAIQMRRGAYANLDRSKLVAGEIVLATDSNFVGIAKAPSQVLQLVTTDMLDLPVASENTLGGIMVGNNLSIDQNGVLSATNGGSFDMTHIQYTRCGVLKYYKIFEWITDSYTDELPIISIIGKSGSYEGSEKNFYACFHWQGSDEVVCYGMVSNKDIPSSGTVVSPNLDIFATYNSGVIRLYLQCRESRGYVDAYINSPVGTIYTDSVAENEMSGTVKCKLTDITPISQKISISVLKDIVADSSDFADFQERIADL